MHSQALQKFVKRIFSDEETKQRFISNPDTFLSEFDLTEPEKRAILLTHANLGVITADSPQLGATVKANYEWFSVPS